MNSPLIVKEFDITRDYKSIMWKETLWYNLLRAFFAGLIFNGISMMLLAPSVGTGQLSTLFTLLALWPVYYLIIFVPLGAIFSLLRWLPFVGALSALFALVFAALGDPIVYIIHKFSPKLVPVESPPLFSLSLIFWVLDAPELTIADG